MPLLRTNAIAASSLGYSRDQSVAPAAYSQGNRPPTILSKARFGSFRFTMRSKSAQMNTATSSRRVLSQFAVPTALAGRPIGLTETRHAQTSRGQARAISSQS